MTKLTMAAMKFSQFRYVGLYRIMACTCIVITLCVLASCTPQDPTKFDLKSPCVYNEHSKYSSNRDPCVHRKPELNARYIV